MGASLGSLSSSTEVWRGQKTSLFFVTVRRKRAFFNKAISGARNAFSGWGIVPFGRRKAILASLLDKIGEHADELSALLTTEQGGPLV